ncbi:MAG: hypothetical protein IRZ33_03345 [Alicyclobacillaceae bacterium]|nr:hypothetical protein [Alicyclobacillaceae bacterium]
MDIRDEYRLAISELSQTYEVPDIILPTAGCVFLLESPHIQELKYRAPVAGASGATMTKHIFGDAYARFPLGLLVKKNAVEQKNRPRLNRIGLMNVCNIPMQRTAYRNADIVRRYGPLLSALEQLRTANHTDRFSDDGLNALQDVLVEHLREKLRRLQDRRLVLVPCGRFAQKFFRLAGVAGPNWTVLENVPHPSYNSWDRQQYQWVIAQLKQMLDDVFQRGTA